MNSLGLSLILKMGCICSRQTVQVNSRKYFVREHLGEGGFSTVELVEDPSSRKRYALKRITCHGLEDQRVALQEVAYHGQVRHPAVLECIDSALVDGPVGTSDVLLLLPYLPRGTLHYELERRAITSNHLSPSELLSIFLQLCEGVRAFHEVSPEPLAHRDLKTSNVLLTEDRRPVIMDLGSTCPARTRVCGSAEAQKLQDWAAERCSMPYRAPELFTVESYCTIDERTDVWSLGCVLYAMCYFKSPFDTVYERGDSVALAVISGNVTFPVNSPYDQDMHDLILFMLKVNPMERPYIYSVLEKVQDTLSRLEGHA